MERVQILIIGAGITGLAVAEKLSHKFKDILVIERCDGFGRETSSRNSEVIHAGLYNPKGSLKTELCIQGRRMIYEFCDKKGIKYKKTGKIVIANTDDEIERVNILKDNGNANGVEGLSMLTKEEIADIEPEVECREGLYSPETGIVDTHGLMSCLEQEASVNGVTHVYNCEVENISKDSNSYVVEIKDTDGEIMEIESEIVINSAGLNSDKIAESVGIDIDKNNYRLSLCKGEYFSVSGRHKGKINMLIYPLPTPVSLGIHVVLSLDGRLRLGPNAFYVDEINYDVDRSHRNDFYENTKTFLPFIKPDDIEPDMSGIRAKLQKSGEGFRDFIIKEETPNGLPGFVNCIGIESPGFTSCLAVAETVKRILKGKL
jgi:L-2-hydroxyglutarate oxidase LhgO